MGMASRGCALPILAAALCAAAEDCTEICEQRTSVGHACRRWTGTAESDKLEACQQGVEVGRFIACTASCNPAADGQGMGARQPLAHYRESRDAGCSDFFRSPSLLACHTGFAQAISRVSALAAAVLAQQPPAHFDRTWLHRLPI